MDVHNLKTIGIKSFEKKIKNLSTFAGKLVVFFLTSILKVYDYIKKIIVKYIDYHFYKNYPINLKNNLCFLEELNTKIKRIFHINKTLQNCLTHYGLGQCMNENGIKSDDVLKELTKKSLIWIIILVKIYNMIILKI